MARVMDIAAKQISNMLRTRTKYIMDLIPFLILVVYAIILVWTLSTTDIAYNWKHIFALCFLTATGILFFWRHQLGVLSLGIMLLTGYFGFLSLSYQLSSFSFGFRPYGFFYLPLVNGQPAIIICTILHFIFSGKYYVGILTKKYWQALSKNEVYSSD